MMAGVLLLAIPAIVGFVALSASHTYAGRRFDSSETPRAIP